MDSMIGKLKTGTTTVGIVCKDGVILGTERRATTGTMIVHKRTQKLFKIDEHIGMTIAGWVGDAQILVRYLTAEIELYHLKREIPISVKGAATLMSNILAAQRILPYMVGLIIGGVDSSGAHVYSLDLLGGCIPDKYVSIGSGSPFVYGVLEDYYREDMSLNDGFDLAIRALVATLKRDGASGDGIDLASISAEKFKILSDEEIKKRLIKMKLTIG